MTHFTGLPFDTEQMISGLSLWVETESPGIDPHSVNKVIDLAVYDLATMGATIERIPGRMGFADSLRACVNPSAACEPGILICCHADTVHETGSLASMPYRREGDYLWGPGIASMKAGLYTCLESVRKIMQHGLSFNLPVTFLIVSDKECGCPSTRELIEATANNNKYVLIPETTERAQTVYSGRHAQQRFKLDVKVDSISIRNHSASSITEMARHIVAIDTMNSDDYRFKVGAIRSGQWVNFAETCTAEVIVDADTSAGIEEGYKKMMALNSPNPDKGLHVNRSVLLPVWQSQASYLQDTYSQVADSMDLTLNAVTARGCSLANIAGGSGVETLDGLGVVGTGMQSRAERIRIDSLTVRAKMMAGLLTSLR